MDSLQLLKSINDGISHLNVQFAVLNERMAQQQEAIKELEASRSNHDNRIVELEKAEDKNGTARAAAWLAAISLAGMLIISAWDSWNARLDERAAEVVRRQAESAYVVREGR